jgi:1,4-dihydroxy-6-naphthoate synthase
MTTKIHIGISTCPNDTFAFHALLNRKIDTGDIQFDFELMDVEELNLRLLDGDFDVSKASFHAAILLADQLAVLSSGSALGFGVGPLLLSAKPDSRPSDVFFDEEGNSRVPVIACPGKHTTATLLYRLFEPNRGEIQQMIFSDIMPKRKNQLMTLIWLTKKIKRSMGLATRMASIETKRSMPRKKKSRRKRIRSMTQSGCT